MSGADGIYCDFRLASGVPNSDKYEKTVVEGSGTDIYSSPIYVKNGTGGFTGNGYLTPGVYSDGATAPSPSLFNVATSGSEIPVPHAFFAIDKSETDTAGLVSAHFYNRVRVRYIVDNKQDQIELTNQEFGSADTTYGLITETQMPVYEAYLLVKIEFEGVSGSLAVFDAEGDNAPDQSIINFGTINV